MDGTEGTEGTDGTEGRDGDGEGDGEGERTHRYPFDADALLSALTAWSADTRTREAVAARTRERWLRQQAQEGATWLGVLVDLAERGSDVTVGLDGRSASGRLVGVGSDLCVLAHAGATTLIALAHVHSVRAGGTPPAAGSDRRPALQVSLPEALAALAAERDPVTVTLGGGGEVRGVLVAMGADVVTLRSRTRPWTHTYVPLAAIATCSPSP